MEKVFINIWYIKYFFAKLDEKGSSVEYVESLKYLPKLDTISVPIAYNLLRYFFQCREILQQNIWLTIAIDFDFLFTIESNKPNDI